MKFFWKIFFVFTAMITAVFSVFGIWMITQSFRNSLKKEIEEGNRESRLFQFAFEVNMNSLSENYQTERIVRELTESIVGNLDGQGYTMPFALDSDGSVIASLGGSTMLPMTVVVDAEGRIVYNKVGSITYELLKSLIEPLID